MYSKFLAIVISLSGLLSCAIPMSSAWLEVIPAESAAIAMLMTSDRSEVLPDNYLQTHTDYLQGIHSSVLIMRLTDSGQTSFCSGFITKLDQDAATIVTNHHCLADYDPPSDLSIPYRGTMPDHACDRTLVSFASDRDVGSECKDGTLRYDSESDMASFEITPPDQGFPDYIQEIPIARGRPKANEPAYMVHFPYDPKVLSSADLAIDPLPRARITKVGCQTIKSGNMLRWYPFENILPFSTEHTCYLFKGSSGSALVSAVSHEVIGLNWGILNTDWGIGGFRRASNAAVSPECISLFLKGAVVDCSD